MRKYSESKRYFDEKKYTDSGEFSEPDECIESETERSSINRKSKKFSGRAAWRRLPAVLLVLGLLTGCGDSGMDDLVTLDTNFYTALDRDTFTCQVGDLQPEFEGTIELAGYQESIYRMETYQMEKLQSEYDASLGELKVSVGDYVREGDTLITFTSDTLTEQIKENENNKTKAALKIEHYRKLMAINPKLDYSTEISNLNNDIYIANLYISDANEAFDTFNIKATQDGVVTFIDETVKGGFIIVGKPMIKIVKDDGYYVLDKSDTVKNKKSSDTYERVNSEVEFHVGDTFTARNYLAEYTVEVIDDPTASDSTSEGGSGNDSDNNSDKNIDNNSDVTSGDTSDASSTDAQSQGKLVESDKVYFRLISNGAIKEKSLRLYADLPVQKGVLYVDRKAISEIDGQKYVYKQNEDGSFRAVKVTIGDTVGLNVVIKEGLEEGDVVALQESK